MYWKTFTNIYLVRNRFDVFVELIKYIDENTRIYSRTKN